MAFEEIAPQRKELIITDVLRYRHGFMGWSLVQVRYRGSEYEFAKMVRDRLDETEVQLAMRGIIAEYITLAEGHGAQDGK